MKKLVICYWSLGIGGIGSRIKVLLSELNTNSDVEVYCLLKRKTTDNNFSKNLDNINFLYYSDAVYSGQKFNFMVWIIKNILSIKPTHTLGFLNRFSLVLVISKFVNLIVNQRNFKITVDLPTNMRKHLKQHEVYWIWFPLTVFFFRIVDRITVPTKANKKNLVKFFLVPDKKINIIYSNLNFDNK